MKSKHFKAWLKSNFVKGLFGRYEQLGDEDGNHGNWSKKELYKKYNIRVL